MQGKYPFISFIVILTLENLSGEHTCGVLTYNTPNDTISYKPFTPIDKHERCVWVIRVENATGYLISVLMDFSGEESEQGINLSCLLHTRHEPVTHLPVNSSGTIIMEACNVIAVTFYSTDKASNHTGFILQYSTLFSGTTSRISTDSKDILLNPSEYYLHYPQNRQSNYSNTELAVFLVQPKARNQTLNVIYILDELEYGCYDFLQIYLFNETMPGPKWQWINTICGNVTSSIVTTTDLTMFTFETDDSNVGAGFGITYTSHPNCSLEVNDTSNSI